MENEYNGSADNDQRLFALRTKPRPCCWRRWLLLPSLLVVMFLMNFSAYSQSADFKQGSNLNKTPLGEITWIGSILNANNSKIYEGMSTLQRLILMDIPTTTGNIHTFQIRMQAEKSGHHAYDFMTSWDNAFQEPALINTALYPTSYTDPKLNVCGDLQNAIATICANLHSAGNIAYLPVVTMEANYSLPGDINTVEQVVASYLAAFQGREIKMYGSDPFTGGTALNHVDFVKYEAGYIFYNITWCSTSSNVIIEFAAHIAAGVNPQPSLIGYGTGQGAADISGGPYHVSTIGFTTGEGSIGNLDNQLQGSSIFIAPPACNPPTGPNLCPNQVGTYSTTVDVGETIVWSLFPSQSVGNSSGAFFPPGENLTLSSVHVNAGSGLSVGSSFTLIATVTNSGGTTSCANIFNVKSNTAPIITTTGTNVNLGCNPSESAINTSFGTATAVDNTGTSISVTTSISGVTGTDCNKSQIATFVATDNCGITVSKTVTITWKVDLVKPVIEATGTTLALGCNPDAAAINAALGTATASDICDGALVPSFTDGAVTGDCIKSQTRTWNATDLCGNTATPVTRTVTWKVDLVKPVIAATGTTLALGCNPDAAAINAALGTATASDICDGALVPSFTDGAVTGDCIKSQTRTWNATDLCGNTATPGTRTVTWKVDLVKPVIAATGTTLALGCNPDAAAINAALGTATASDICDGALVPSFTDGAVTGDCIKSQTRTWNATDLCGNTATPVTRTVTWKVDLVKPVIAATGTTLALGCNPDAAAINAALGTATASDICDGALVPSFTDGAVTGDCIKSQTRTWNATDLCGNTATPVTRTVTWKVDLVKPVIAATGTTLALGCNPDAAAINAALGTATASDICDGALVPSFTDGAVTGDCIKSQTRTWNATDLCGNTATPVTRTVTWKVDLVKPVIEATGTTLALGCNPDAAAINAALGTATASDICDGALVPSFTDGAVTGDCIKSQTRTWNATDLCGNTATPVTRTVTWKVDLVKPVIEATGTTLALGCNPDAAAINAALGTATASDICDGALVPSFTDGAVTGDCIKSQTRTWNATDLCGNTATPVTRTVTWKVDLVKPVIAATGTTLALGCNPDAAAINAALGTATASDICDGALVPSFTDGAVTGDCIKSQTRTWNATDLCGNTATPVTRTVTWKVDLVKPVIEATGTTLALGCNPDAAAINAALGTATASDICDGALVPSFTDGAVTGDCIKSQTRTWNATDLCGNTATPVTRTVTWKVDLVKPVIEATGTTLALGCNPDAAAINAALGTATASDICDGALVPSFTDGAVTGDCIKSQTRTWNATDLCGNTATPVTRTVTWKVDLVKPVIEATGTTLALGCNPDAAAINAALGTATASDICDGALVPSFTDGAVTGDCIKSQTRTWNATDLCGNTATPVTRTVTWKVDLVKPVIAATGTTLALGCNPDAAAINAALGTATASDICDGALVPSFTDGAVTGDCIKSQTRTWNATDLCGNTATPVTRTVTWKVDLVKPVIAATGTTLALGCNPDAAAINAALGTATASDICDGALVPSFTDGAVTGDCIKSQTRTWNATDLCGNTATPVTRTVTWKVDLVKPVIEATGTTLALGCNPDAAAINAALGTATASDICDGALVPSFTDGAVTGDCIKSQTRTWNATDLCGNTATPGTRTVTWKVDLVKPVIAATGTTLALGCNPDAAAINAALGTATASDICDGALVPSFTDGAVTGDCIKSQTRTWNATDLCGNTATPVTRTVTWKVDLVKPVIEATGTTLALGCNPDAAAINAALGTATASDICDGALVPSFTDGAVTGDCIKSQTRTWNATDLCGNTATPVTRTVTWKVDLVKPVIAATGTTLALGCNPDAAAINAALGTATASDICDGALVPSFTDGAVTGDCIKSQTRTWNATDLCGNTATPVTRTVTWKVDLVKPVIAATGTTLALGCNPDAAAINAALGTATASDICDGALVPSFTDGAVTGDCIKSQTRTWNATDLCGNTATPVTRTVTWKVDLVKPVIEATGTTLALGCNPDAAAINAALGTATASDICDGALVPSFTDGAVTGDCIKSQTRTWNATDLCGNTATPVTRTVTWKVDLVKPVIEATGTTLALGCNPDAAAINAALGTATASDICDGALVPSFTDGAVTGDCIKSQTRTWNATDLCGNTATPVTRTVTWKVDLVKPVIAATGTTLALGCNPDAAAINAALGTATASDICDGALVPSFTDGAVTGDCIKSQTRTWNATDLCGNTATPGTRTVTWKVDLVKPVIAATGTTLALGCNPDAAAINAALGTATASDICDGALVPSFTDGAVTGDCIKSQTRTWNATDLCGNTATPVTRTVTWKVDLVKPVIEATGTTLALGCNPDAAAINAALGTATASDICDGALVPSFTDGAVTGDCIKSQTRTWNATDLCGNTATPVTRTVTWKVDLVKPVIAATGTTLALGCNPDAAAINAALGTATASDICDGALVPSFTDGAVTGDCIKSQTRTWNATDLCGNTATPVTRTVTWKVDLVKPVIEATGTTLALGCNPDAAAINAALGTATASDICDGALVPSFTDGAVTGDCIKSQTRTWNATDLCGNTATPVTRTVTWKVDLVKPVIEATGTTLALGCNPDAAAINAALGTATASDICDGALVPSFTDGAVTGDCIKSQTRTWNATDLCGNTATPVTRTVTWKVDLVKPVIAATGTTLALGCNPDAAAINAALGTATASDICDGALVPSFTDGAVTGDCIKSQTRTWNATDLCGNTATPVTRTVTWKVDLVKPVIEATGTTLALGCNPDAAAINAALGTATASDICDGALVPSFTDGAVTGDCIKSQTRTWNATDLCGNTATPVTRTVTWKVDLVKPVIAATGTTLALGCNPDAAAINAALGTATASDICDGALVPSFTDGAVTGDCIKSQTRTWNATDLCGNTATPVTRTVTWKVDLVKPVIAATGTTLALGCNPDAAAINAALGTATASDICDGALVPSFTDGAVTGDCIKSQTRTWNATDLCGNTATPVTRTVTWKVDLTGPELQEPIADLVFECYEKVIIPEPVFIDGCDGQVERFTKINGVNGDVYNYKYPVGITPICFIATDECGNSTEVCINVTVKTCQAICTYTQGYYGNPGGKSCDGVTQFSTAGLIEHAINSYGGTMVIGKAGHSISITSSALDISKVIEYLPGGAGIGALSAGNISISSSAFKTLYTRTTGKTTKINNKLLAQTITLGLNLGMSINLGNLELMPGMWIATAKSDGGCGSTTTNVDGCNYSYFQIDQAIINAIPGDKTIAGLFELANRALGGMTVGASLTAIASAVDQINNAFDGCSLFMGYYAQKLVCPTTTPEAPKVAQITPAGFEVSTLKVYPNPFQNKVTFEFVSAKDSHAVLEINNILGQKITTLMDKDVKMGAVNQLEYQPINVVPGILIYRLILDGNVQTGRLIYKK